MPLDDQILLACQAGFLCITADALTAVKLYDIRAAAGLAAMTPQALITAAKCEICQFGNAAQGVEVWMLAQMAA